MKKISTTKRATGKSGVRADDQTVLSIPMTKDMKEELGRLAGLEGRTLAAFVRLYLSMVVEAELKGDFALKTIKVRSGQLQVQRGPCEIETTISATDHMEDARAAAREAARPSAKSSRKTG